MYSINKVVMIDTRVLRDTSLSLDAKGLFAILSALPEKTIPQRSWWIFAENGLRKAMVLSNIFYMNLCDMVM